MIDFCEIDFQLFGCFKLGSCRTLLWFNYLPSLTEYFEFIALGLETITARSVYYNLPYLC